MFSFKADMSCNKPRVRKHWIKNTLAPGGIIMFDERKAPVVHDMFLRHSFNTFLCRAVWVSLRHNVSIYNIMKHFTAASELFKCKKQILTPSTIASIMLTSSKSCTWYSHHKQLISIYKSCCVHMWSAPLQWCRREEKHNGFQDDSALSAHSFDLVIAFN